MSKEKEQEDKILVNIRNDEFGFPVLIPHTREEYNLLWRDVNTTTTRASRKAPLDTDSNPANFVGLEPVPRSSRTGL